MLAIVPSVLMLGLVVMPSTQPSAAVGHFGRGAVRCARPPSCCDKPPGLGGRVPLPQGPSNDRSSVTLGGITRPLGARSTVSRTDAGSLLIRIPAAGLSSGTLFGGAFSVAWFSAIVPATFASGGAGGLFMLPFWLAGGAVAKQTILDPARATSLSIGEFAWEVRSALPLGDVTISTRDGPTDELEGASVEVAAYVNGVPSYVLRLFAGAAPLNMGEGLASSELEWLAEEINGYVRALRGDRDAER